MCSTHRECRFSLQHIGKVYYGLQHIAPSKLILFSWEEGSIERPSWPLWSTCHVLPALCFIFSSLPSHWCFYCSTSQHTDRRARRPIPSVTSCAIARSCCRRLDESGRSARCFMSCRPKAVILSLADTRSSSASAKCTSNQHYCASNRCYIWFFILQILL